MEEKNYTSEELEEQYKKILNYYISRYNPSEKPKAILLGGQPGAGKTGLENMINLKNEYVSISGDDYRKFHPRYKELNLEYGRESSKYTQVWASEMTGRLIKELREKKYNLIVEGTLRKASLPLKEAEALKENGYLVELHVIAVKPEKSYLGTLERYEKMLANGRIPRMTPKDHHDLVVNNIAQNLETIYKAKVFDNIKIYNRNNELLYNYKENENINPKNILENEFNRKWEIEEIKEYKERWDNVINMMTNRKAPTEEIKIIENEKVAIFNKLNTLKEKINSPIRKKKKEKEENQR